jgi:hypothetical protein
VNQPVIIVNHKATTVLRDQMTADILVTAIMVVDGKSFYGRATADVGPFADETATQVATVKATVDAVNDLDRAITAAREVNK